MIISVDGEEKSISQDPKFITEKKTLNELGTEINFLITIKGLYEKPTGHITLLGKRLTTSVLKCERRQVSLLPSLLFIIVLRVLASAIRQK